MGWGENAAIPTRIESFEGRVSAGRRLRRAVMAALVLPFLGAGCLVVADHRGLFGGDQRMALREFAIVVALLGFLLINARLLRRIDHERRKAAVSLRAANRSLQTWVDEQARIEEELRDSERRYRFLADAMPQMIWTARPDGDLDYCNRRWSDYTGQTLDQAEGWGWIPVIHPDDIAHCLERWTQAFRSGERYEIEYQIRRGDGAFRWHLGRAEPMRDEDGRIVRWFGTCTDIDDQKRVEAELRQARESLSDRVAARTAELEAANAALVAEVAERKLAEEAAQSASLAKGEFLANMSHEIRTPMNGILGMIELALATPLAPTQREYLQIVASSADALLTVINDILDFSKIEAGKLELDPVPFPVRDAITDTLRSLALRAHAKGLELACRIAPDVPRSVVGDSGRLRQVLVNLIGNAIKFTERGEVVVSVALAEGGDADADADADANAGAPGSSSATFRFTVVDTGIGIPEHKRETIFAAFEQADGSTTRRYGGTGLGLAISAKLVALMGGTIVVEANPGGGSVFRFDARFAVDADAALEVAPTDPATLDGLRVLVVDDNATNRRIMVEVLAQWSCRPVAVADGASALREAAAAADRGEPYAAVLLDCLMPAMDGLDLAARLRAWEAEAAPGAPRLRLLMLTSAGFAPPDQPGLDGWLQKPVRQSELFNLLLGLLASPRPLGEPEAIHPEPPAPTPTTTRERPVAPARPLEILLAEDHPVNQRVATRMIEDLGHRVVVVGDGRAAVEVSASGRFDLILMDVQMPELDGFEALAAIRGRELMAAEAAGRRDEAEAPHLPIIALTAHAMTGDRERCLNAGFDDYLSKPVTSAKVRGVLARFAPNISPPATPAVVIEPPAPAFDRRAALEAMGGMEELLDEVIHLFVDDSPRLLDEIRRAADAEDHVALGRLGHTMAGSAGNFGPNPVIAAAHQVERAARAGAPRVEALALVDHLDQAYGRFQPALLAEVGTCP